MEIKKRSKLPSKDTERILKRQYNEKRSKRDQNYHQKEIKRILKG